MAGKTKPSVLRLGLVEHAFTAWSEIENIADTYVPKSTDREGFIAECRAGAFDGVETIYRTIDSFEITGRIDQELVASLPESVSFICHCGAGYDQIDITACTNRRPRPILVSNTPTAVDDSTADLGIFLLLGALRNLPASMVSVRAGSWRGNPLPRLGHDPQGKVLGILGMGGIGRNMAQKARVFELKIRYHNRTRLNATSETELGAEYVDFDTLLRESDVLSLNLPLNPQTRHLISTPQFVLMKPGVVVINTARGAVMDESALVAALESGRVASAGLDVYEDEPVVHPGLLSNPNVLLVPHMGTWTVETETKMEEWAMENVMRAVKEGQLRSVVGEQRALYKETTGFEAETEAT